MSDRPSMSQDWHADHNIPDSEYDGTQITSDGVKGTYTKAAQEAKSWVRDRMEQGARDKSWETDPSNWRNK